MTRTDFGLYSGPALALVGELAQLRIEDGHVTDARFFRMSLGLFVWRSYEGGTFRIKMP